MSNYGYCRISTVKQSIERQERNIKSRYPDAIIIKEVKDLQQRTKEGLVTAKLNGKQLGHQVGTKLVTKKSIKADTEVLKRFWR